MTFGENQTDPSDLANATSATRGSGIFAVPNPLVGNFGSVTKIVVKSITYTECVQRGMFCIAFKWVPRQLDANVTACPTQGSLCVKSCANDLCLCIDGTCQ